MARKPSLFEKLGLIVPEGEPSAPAPSLADLDAQLANLTSAVSSAPSAAPAASASPSFQDEADLSLPEGVDFATIYAEGDVPATPFTIEKLAKLVDGLNQLDASTKKTAVSAMDAADDSWKIEDVIADGQAKIAALNAYLGDIAACEAAINEEVNRRVNENQSQKGKTLEDLDARIAKLQADREAAISEAAARASSLRAQSAAAAEAAERERTRITNAIKGHQGLVALFGSTTTTTN